MLKSSISSYLVQIYPARKQSDIVNLSTLFDGKKDIIDIVQEHLNNGSAFNLPKTRFGAETAAEVAESSQPESSEPDIKKPNSLTIALSEMIEAGTWSDESGANVCKYVYFSVEYGESGDRGVLKRASGEKVLILPPDYYCRIHHILFVYPDDDDAQFGMVYFEARGEHSIITTMRKVIKNAVRLIDANRYSADLKEFGEKNVIEELIRTGKIKQVTIMNNIPVRENGERMSYEARQITYFSPSAPTLREKLKLLFSSGVAATSSDESNRIQEIDDSEATGINFTISTSSGRNRTFTAGKPNTGIVQEVLADVVMADGTTNPTRLLKELKRIYFEQNQLRQ